MADGSLSPVSRPAWQRILGVYLASRVITTTLMLLSAAIAPAWGRHGAEATPLDYAVAWDGAWYREIALFGYPTELPRGEDGMVTQNAWAFMPLFPMIARGAAALIPGARPGADDVWAVANAWAGCAVAIALVSGYAVCVLLHALLAPRIGDRSAMFAVALVAFGPLAAMFQVAYAESMFLALLLAALLCVQRRRWAPLYALVPAMGFTRPGVLAFALALALVGLSRLRHRRVDPILRSEVGHVLAIGALATAVGFAWPAIVGRVTGEADGYLATELSWRRTWVGDAAEGFLPAEGWLQAADAWAGVWGIPAWAGYALLVLLLAGAIAALSSRPVRALGVEVHAWGAAYAIYLLLVFFPQSSVFRLLFPLAPLAGAIAVATARSVRARYLVFAGGILAQGTWITAMYGYGHTFWLVP
ncbi:hypothetical protein [Microbacterium sp. gxy059]|uniref:hypothetical protein n=1 Tax=Microbacterium sp. gxy059 TaxID=2957199 RepID=UPI003D973068